MKESRLCEQWWRKIASLPACSKECVRFCVGKDWIVAGSGGLGTV